MKRLYFGLFALMVISSFTFAQVEHKSGLTVSRIVVCEDVIDLEPVAIDSVFTGVERLCCFTEIKGDEELTDIQHVWYHGENEMARINLIVRAPRWRTYSAKKILPEITGDWRIEIIDAEGRKISQISFQVE